MAGLPPAGAQGSGSTSLNTVDPGTFAQPKSLLSKPLPTTFVVTVTDNILLQLWEGTVLGLENDEFTAVLRDKTDEDRPDEEVVLGTDEIDPEDLKLLRLGAVFYWSVRYEQGPGLPRRRVSRIRFRRIPGWTASELNKARLIGKDIKAIWSSNVQDSTTE